MTILVSFFWKKSEKSVNFLGKKNRKIFSFTPSFDSEHCAPYPIKKRGGHFWGGGGVCMSLSGKKPYFCVSLVGKNPNLFIKIGGKIFLSTIFQKWSCVKHVSEHWHFKIRQLLEGRGCCSTRGQSQQGKASHFDLKLTWMGMQIVK